MRLHVHIAASLFILTACSSEPDNYDDCILKYMQGTGGTHAATLIRGICEKKFPRDPLKKQASRSEGDAPWLGDPIVDDE